MTEILFLVVLEAGHLTSGCQHGQILVRTLFLTCMKKMVNHLLAVSSQKGDREMELSGISAYEGTSLTMRTLPS